MPKIPGSKRVFLGVAFHSVDTRWQDFSLFTRLGEFLLVLCLRCNVFFIFSVLHSVQWFVSLLACIHVLGV
jgi:hypothetical protein